MMSESPPLSSPSSSSSSSWRSRWAQRWRTMRNRTLDILTRRKPMDEVLASQASFASLQKVLTWVDLIGIGSGSIIGAGLFVLTGVAARNYAGPAITLDYLFTGIVCIFSGLCYAEFACRIPVAGSAYLYAYCSLGEFTAWIVGWCLVLEYLLAAAAVARGWTAYFMAIFQGFGVDLPHQLNYIPYGCKESELPASSSNAEPPLECSNIDVLAFVICIVFSVICALGTKGSATLNNVVMGVTILLIFFLIIAGAVYVDPDNWTPFFPFPAAQTINGAGVIFFAYIGFDAVSTVAEDVKNPKRDLPIGIIGSILISATLYSAVSLVVTGMVPYSELDLNAPMAKAFAVHGAHWGEVIVSVGAFLAITTSILSEFIAIPRILLAMSRDGLLFHFFQQIHPRFGTPFYGTLFSGGFAAVLTLLVDIEILADMVSIGTLIAFIIVCSAVIILRARTQEKSKRATLLVSWYAASWILPMLSFRFGWHYAATIVLLLLPIPPTVFIFRLRQVDIPTSFACPWVPLVPLVGIMFNMNLILNLGYMTWVRLVVWLVCGVVLYAFYGRRYSTIAHPNEHALLGSEEFDKQGTANDDNNDAAPISRQQDEQGEDEYNDDEGSHSGYTEVPLTPFTANQQPREYL